MGAGLYRARSIGYSSASFAVGAIAQLGERYNGIVEVVGSIPTGSTKIQSPHRLEA